MATDRVEAILIYSDSNAEDGETLAERLAKMAVGKHPVIEEPSQKKKTTHPLWTGAL